ncbi:MAG TPA: sulfatase-like hydrolase/transferase [Arenimonas sp.]|uniref:sulfatase-like hydrolase/transferase n=1 Tax=Arenimonas sp. TaxID=1872635 RepID=UPI002BC59B9C|nr:sulfatase-like hydrolase/transferase [Arenimonas sp.]HMB57144.1 sulfatase-like hydrolase/transferase [Arenimonas sp.]
MALTGDAASKQEARSFFGLRAADVWALLALLALAALSGYRAHLVNAAFGQYTACPHCLDTTVWVDDAWLFAVLPVLLVLSQWLRNRPLRRLLALTVAIAVIAYGVDIVVFRLLTQRLLWIDVLHFAGDGAAMFSVFRPLLTRWQGWVLLLTILIAAFAAAAAIISAANSRRRMLFWSVIAALAVAAGWLFPPLPYINMQAYQNLWQVNHEIDPGRAYSTEFHRQTLAQPPPALQCETGRAQKTSVVLVVVESLSAYHSKLFSGLNDDTPQLDQLARGGSYFSHFYANGYSTEGGLISLLTGYVPIPTAGSFGTTMAFTQTQGDFHRWLRGQGYQTAFFTSGLITLGNRGGWLQKLGIEHAEGSEQPFYAGMPQGAFDAPEDGALVERFLQWHAHERRPGPFMATVLTVGTHPPFLLANSGRMDETASVREVDRQLAHLASVLAARGFFRDGLLLIVGDHRAMTPIRPAEQRVLGASASAHVVALALGRTGLPLGESPQHLQQTDLIPSLRYLIGDRACRNDWQGLFFGGPPQPAKYVVHTDPMRRNEVSVLAGDSDYRLLLDGDATHWRQAPADSAEADRLRTQVNRERMSRMVEFGYRP